jgi:RimJ/RimL family protein N-acetyltransferase
MTTSCPLTGPRLVLRPLAASDADALVRAAADGDLWTSKLTGIPSAATVADYLRIALEGAAAGTMLPFVTTLRTSGEVVGSTRFWKVDQRNRKAEIGHTWIAASHQRSFVNTEAKYLMLRHAFETWGLLRVQLQTDALNQRSRDAILRLGATQEGLLRKERVMPDGRQRDTLRFSIIDDEWPQVKARLEARMQTNTEVTT